MHSVETLILSQLGQNCLNRFNMFKEYTDGHLENDGFDADSLQQGSVDTLTEFLRQNDRKLLAVGIFMTYDGNLILDWVSEQFNDTTELEFKSDHRVEFFLAGQVEGEILIDDKLDLDLLYTAMSDITTDQEHAKALTIVSPVFDQPPEVTSTRGALFKRSLENIEFYEAKEFPI